MFHTKLSKIFDRSFVASSLKETCRCPKCFLPYTSHFDKLNKDQHVKSNRPILLPCGHNMCENCVYHNRNNLTCIICLFPIMLPKDQTKLPNFNVRDYFDMNFFMMGQLNHWRFYCKEGSANNTLFMSATGRSNVNNTNLEGDASAAQSSVIKCVECESCPSSGKCRVCKAYYCKRCFDNIHKNSKVLRMHSMINLDKKQSFQSELMYLTKPRFCRRHQRVCDRYCKKCDLVCCSECARQDHQYHNFKILAEENNHYLEELQLALGNTHLALENLNKSQKDIKSVETQFEEYATKTLEEISNHFVQLHSFLQNEEKQIMEKFGEMSNMPQFMIRETNVKLNEAHETLSKIRSTLEQYEEIPPGNVYLGHILPKYNQIIQQLPTFAQINRPKSNPFIFEVKHDIKQDIQNSMNYKYKDPKLFIKIDTPFYDSNPSGMDVTNASLPSFVNLTQTKNASPKRNKKKFTNKNMRNQNVNDNDNNPDAATTMSANANSKSNTANLVRVTNIKSPEDFYIQNINDAEMIRKLSHTYLCKDISNIAPTSISQGRHYMAYHVVDKQWYRGLLDRIMSNDLYKVFLIDFGTTVNVSKDNLCTIEDKHLEVPYAAKHCSLYDVMPAGKKWTEVETNLLLELLQNKPVRASTITVVNDNLWKIDLHTDLTKSVRDTFLYTGLARERPGKHSFKMQPKVNLPIMKIEERIPKITIYDNETPMVTALHIEGPDEFYIIKNDLIDSKEELKAELNQHYNSELSKPQQIYLGTVHMCCAVNINGVWYRAVVEEVKDKGQLYVRLVDEGRRELINWRQAFVLIDKYRNKREFAIACMLADIEPLQENNYVYTAAAIKDFKQMLRNPQLRMEVVSVTPKFCKVVLHICKGSVDINIGGVLVKQKYGASSGESTQVAEIVKTPRLNKCQEKTKAVSNDNSSKALASNINAVKRSLIKLTHLVSPFEFYIQLATLVQGTKTFYQQIQEAQAKKYVNEQALPYETREWYEDNHCLVYTKHHNVQSTELCKGSLLEQCEWYRGIITEISYLPGEEPTYSVFLRDVGVTICLVHSQQLYSIDPQLDRVTNAVYRCHLACIEPAGGQSWSQSAIDCFTHYIVTAETLSVSLHGKRKRDQKSLAVVLWSSRMETENPLAPCITKYSNINRHLVKKGLAHLVEPLDTKQLFDQIEEMELENNEIPLDQWLKSFADNGVFKDENLQQQAGRNVDENNDDHPFSKFLTEIDFTDTTGKKAPAAWLTHKLISKTLFTGYPTYIDFDATVYLHEASDKKLLEKIAQKLTEAYGPMEPPPADVPFAIDQACVVKYHADSKYYRGVITEHVNADNEWGVKFIDYGNVESVEIKDMRLYAPFPNLPAMSSKYIVDGIKPKGGASKFATDELDQMHGLLVTKFVSLSIPVSEMHKNVKRCSMRLGAKDVASEFIERGLAEGDYKPFGSKTLSTEREDGASILSRNQLRKNRNPLASAAMDDYAVFSQENDMSVDCSFIQTAAQHVDHDDDNLTDNSDDADDDDGAKYDHLNEMLERLSKNADGDADQLSKPSLKNTIETSTSVNVTNRPPPKKRLFNEKDYTKMMNVMMVYDDKDIFDNIDQDFDIDLNQQNETEDEGDDFVELGESFAMNYWHNAFEEMREEENEEISEQLNRRVLSFDDDAESDFELFHPEDTSTILTHFSGLENFKLPQLPSAMHHFKCRVVFIMTPVILQIFPLHNEFSYRDIDLQRTIKELVKQSLPPLTNFEPRTLCLACYTKDKHWYRAVVRSYNSVAKTVDVLYVDYLNSETLPLKYVRQCPTELLSWPLRTFRVRLYGITANPNVKELEIRKSLQKLLNKRELFAVVKKHPVTNSMMFGKSLNKTDHIEVVLYESKEASLKGVTVYDSLIENNYLRRY